MADEKDDVVGWCVVELMGHRRLTAFVRPVELAGHGFLRLDVPGPQTKDEAGPFAATQIVSPSAVYCLTPTTAELALKAAGINAVAPVSRWDLPQEEKRLPAAPSYSRYAGDEPDAGDGEEDEADDLPVF